ncbi:hypothetical protein T4C_4541 [Trichinella pseudospiralis]|uniref:Uncharacterized protein n=1 Tax=Trichinella pseudospiralis TaxID=6337 RepID=A0A0V1GLT5_TRIPS|nr:hypothetical protein T4C_4541 [Trichinella pseudospiralis]
MKNSNLLSPQIDENAKSPPPSRFFSWKAQISPPLKTRKNAKSPPLCWASKTQSPLPWEQGKNTKLPTHLRQVKQLSLTHLFSAESLGFPRSRVGKRALYLPKEQGRLHSPSLC